jgi:ribosomal protein S4
MTRHILIKSRSKLCGKLEFDIMHYCALNPFKLTKGLRNLFRLSFDKKFFIKRDRLSNIFSKADKKLSKLFNKKKSYYYNILILKKKIRFFFGIISDNFIQDQLFYIFRYKRSVKGLKLMDALSRAFEMRIDFLVLRLRYVFSLKSSRDYVSSGLVLLNGIRIFDYSLRANLGDIIMPFAVKSKILLFKSLYLNYFGEYIIKSGFLRSIVKFSLFKFYIYRLRKLVFRRRFRLVRLFYKKNISNRVGGSLKWFSIFNVNFLRHWHFFTSKVVSFSYKYRNVHKYIYYKNNKFLFKRGGVYNTRFLFNNKVVSYQNKFIDFFFKNLMNNKFKSNLYIFSIYYSIKSFELIYKFFKFISFYFNLFFTLNLVSVFFFKSKLSLIKQKIVLNIGMCNIYIKKILIKFKNFIKILIVKKLKFRFFFFLMPPFNFNYFSISHNYVFFLHQLVLLLKFKLNKLQYHIHNLYLFNLNFSNILTNIFLYKNNSELHLFSLFYFISRFTKRFFLSFKKSFFIKFFLFFKKFKNLSFTFFILFLRIKLKGRIKVKKFKNKNFRWLKRQKRVKFKRVVFLDFLFKKRRTIRLWSIRLLERIFNLIQFFRFAVRKRLKFYKLRKREYSFFLMGKNYQTRRKFFKKYRRFTALNYLKYTLFRFNIFLRKRIYRYNVKKRKNIKLRSKRLLNFKYRRGIYISIFNSLSFVARSHLLRRHLGFFNKKIFRRRRIFERKLFVKK